MKAMIPPSVLPRADLDEDDSKPQPLPRFMLLPPVPLNPALYQRLVQVFGDVEICNAGEHAVLGRDTLGRQCFVRWGESYRVACPFCDDPGKNLSFHYFVGKRNESGGLNQHLITCFRNRCLADRDRRSQIVEQVVMQLPNVS